MNLYTEKINTVSLECFVIFKYDICYMYVQESVVIIPSHVSSSQNKTLYLTKN